MTELFTPAGPGSLMRSVTIDDVGVFHVARRTCELYSVEIMSGWGRLRASNGRGRSLWYQPSIFTGSFVIGCEAEEGLIVEIQGGPPTVNVNFREKTRDLV